MAGLMYMSDEINAIYQDAQTDEYTTEGCTACGSIDCPGDCEESERCPACGVPFCEGTCLLPHVTWHATVDGGYAWDDGSDLLW